MSIGRWHEEPIRKKHNRDPFNCGEAALDEFLKHYARRSDEMGASKTFLAISEASYKTIVGYYS